jgi:hypothetical protein
MTRPLIFDIITLRWLPLDGKVPATLPNKNYPHKWGVGAPMLKNSDIEKHIKSKGEKGNLSYSLLVQIVDTVYLERRRCGRLLCQYQLYQLLLMCYRRQRLLWYY